MYYGGQRQYTAIENLRDRSWRPAEPFRVVTLRRRSPEPNVVAGYYGLDTFDASINLVPNALPLWWEHAINRPDGPTDSPYDTRLTTNWRHWDGANYRIDAHVRPSALGIANVGYVISPFALSGAGITPVQEPAPDERLWTLPDPTSLSYYTGRIRRLFRPGKVFIYAIADPLPRVYAPSGMDRAPDGQPLSEFIAHVLTRAPARIAVLRDEDAARLGRGVAPFAIRSVSVVKDGFDITLDAPNGGVLVVNQAYTPFWRASADGQASPLTAANLIHMAVAVPSRAKTISLRYCRPLLREQIAGWLGAARSCP